MNKVYKYCDANFHQLMTTIFVVFAFLFTAIVISRTNIKPENQELYTFGFLGAFTLFLMLSFIRFFVSVVFNGLIKVTVSEEQFKNITTVCYEDTESQCKRFYYTQNVYLCLLWGRKIEHSIRLPGQYSAYLPGEYKMDDYIGGFKALGFYMLESRPDVYLKQVS